MCVGNVAAINKADFVGGLIMAKGPITAKEFWDRVTERCDAQEDERRRGIRWLRHGTF